MKTENQFVERHQGIEAALQRSAQTALIVGVLILGAAGLYFALLYLITH